MQRNEWDCYCFLPAYYYIDWVIGLLNSIWFECGFFKTWVPLRIILKKDTSFSIIWCELLTDDFPLFNISGFLSAKYSKEQAQRACYKIKINLFLVKQISFWPCNLVKRSERQHNCNTWKYFTCFRNALRVKTVIKKMAYPSGMKKINFD